MTDRPSPHLLQQQLQLWRKHAPFDAMAEPALRQLVESAEQVYFGPGEVITQPDDGPARQLFVVKSGLVSARHGLAELEAGGQGWQYEAGDCFPMAALMNERAVTATYAAEGDVFIWRIPSTVVREVANISPPLAAHLSERVLQLLALAGREQGRQARELALAEQSMEKPLGELMRKKVLTVSPDTPLELALRTMAQRRIGSVMVVDAQQRPLGILTRDDVLDRITLPQRSLQTPIDKVMSAPVRTLSSHHTAQDAALLMSRHTLRHVPVVEEGRLVGIVSERDLFAHSRLSVQRVGSELRAADSVEAVIELAPRIRELSSLLAGQGLGARTLTGLIAHLNDLLTERLVLLHAEQLGLDMTQACWLAFGSEGRGEQTIATDQDNGIVFASNDVERDRPQWLALGAAVCASLDRAGFPLCKGGVMASNPDCCRSVAEWQEAFGEWLGQGTPEDLLRVSIFFDARAVAGQEDLATPLRELARGPASPRFLRLMAENALKWKVPLSWRGALDPEEREGPNGRESGLDLKLNGSALFVDCARLLALAQGVEAVSTRDRLQAAGAAMGIEEAEREGWAAAFEFLQGLRLKVQLTQQGEASNWVAIRQLNDLDRRTLRVSLRVAQRLQQRLQLDYLRN
ncbi:MAG: CBS domain-containing protein [Burkholderiales bacterium]|nr:CBS domain-containing protein [Burkholderiales bacterium]